jgi:hypothetical protein
VKQQPSREPAGDREVGRSCASLLLAVAEAAKLRERLVHPAQRVDDVPHGGVVADAEPRASEPSRVHTKPQAREAAARGMKDPAARSAE